MKSLNKIPNKKISTKIYIPVIIASCFIFIFFLTSIFLGNKNIKEESVSFTKTSGQAESSLVASKSTPTPTKNPVVQAPPPVFSGNQLKIPVLYYHYVGNNPNSADLQRDVLSISPEKFTEQMRYLKENGYNSISYDTLYAALRNQATLPSKPVILTFDDGYIDFYYNAYNILRLYGLSATVFIPTGLVGKPAYLTWPMIEEMYSSGLINFGAHSVNHVHLASISPDLALKELQDSKKDLQDHLGLNINYLAYPYGETSSSVINLVQQAGYIGAIGTWSNKIQSEGTIYNSPRLRISGSIDIASFASLLQ